jgi:CHAT domain-containing protein/Tfp pilus assembly protein PilF
MMRMGKYIRRWQRVVALLVLVLGFSLRVPAQTAEHFAAEPVYFDYPAGWGVARGQSNPQLLGFVLARAGLNAQISLYFAPNEITAPASSVPTLLDAARTSLVLPLIEQFIQPLEAAGAQVERTRATTEIGGGSVNGDRWIVSAAGQSVTVEAYLLALHNHLIIVSLNQPTSAAAQVAPAWEMFRRTLSIGAPATAANATPNTNEAAPASAMPSTETIQQATALLTELTGLTKQVNDLRDAGNYNAAVPIAERALTLAEQIEKLDMLPQFKPTPVPGALNMLAELNRATGNYERAEPLFQRAITLVEQRKGQSDPLLAILLNNLGSLYYETGAYDKALPLFERTCKLFEQTKGAEHPDTATAISNLAQIYDATNDFARAEELMKRALAIREKALGAEHPDVAISLSNLGSLYDEMGEPDRAEPLFRRALAIREKVSGPDHPEVATLLNNLALLFKHKGDSLQAESYFNRALAIDEKALGPDHSALANPLDSLAQLFMDRGDYAHAESLFKRALAIREKAFGPDHPDVAESLNNLANLYQERTEYAQAEPLYERARAIFEKRLGPEHKLVATALDNLATLYRAENRYDQAEPLMQRALAIRQKLFGAESLDAAVSYNNLGGLAFARGDYARAEELHQRALRIYEKTFGAEHPQLAAFLSNLSTDYYGAGQLARAIETQARASEINERLIALTLATGSEEQKRLFMATLAEDTNYTLFVHADAAPNDPRALRLALTTVLQRKGRVLDAMSDQIGALRRHLKPEDRALLEQLSTASAELATLVLKGPGQQSPTEYQDRLAKLNAQVNDLQAQVSARSAEFRAQSQPVTLERVQAALPKGAALVEFALYRPFNLKGKSRAERFGAPRYVAYVLHNAQPPTWVELGAAAPIDQAIAEWRKALAEPRRTDVQQLARALDERIMRPVRRLLGDTRQVFLSPDSTLNLIPFGALVDEQNRYLVEDYSITYLTSGRDLLRLSVQAENKQGPVVVADPSFDASVNASNTTNAPATSNKQSAPTQKANEAATGRGAETGRRSFDFASAHFSRLPGTAEEGRAIGTIMPGLKLLTGAQATEAALKQLSGPLVLHIATHGFFLPDQTQTETASGTRGLALGAPTLPGENPLLRSGLALAGANVRQSAGGEDGVLTALEAAGLDLWGTKLVVLSACETGLGALQAGDARVGDGVYGLRRALVLAGAESQVMSLWQVSDAATRDLMVEYYRRLEAGEGRTEALRQVQLAMIKSHQQSVTGGAQRGLSSEMGQPVQTSEDRSHPFYWASFIQSGDWRSMNKK